jgi:hypothetical protein
MPTEDKDCKGCLFLLKSHRSDNGYCIHYNNHGPKQIFSKEKPDWCEGKKKFEVYFKEILLNGYSVI